MGLGCGVRQDASDGVLNQYAIMFQGRAGRAVQFHLRLRVGSHGADQVKLRQGKIALC